jgi:hypothetical protein
MELKKAEKSERRNQRELAGLAIPEKKMMMTVSQKQTIYTKIFLKFSNFL